MSTIFRKRQTDNNSDIIKYMDDLMQSDLYIKQKKLQEEL